MIEFPLPLLLLEAVEPSVWLTIVAPVASGFVGITGAYLTWRVQTRQVGAQQTTAEAARDKNISDLINARAGEWRDVLMRQDAVIARLESDNATFRAQMAELRAENAELRANHARDMATLTAQNEECQRLTHALIVRIEELSFRG